MCRAQQVDLLLFDKLRLYESIDTGSGPLAL